MAHISKRIEGWQLSSLFFYFFFFFLFLFYFILFFGWYCFVLYCLWLDTLQHCLVLMAGACHRFQGLGSQVWHSCLFPFILSILISTPDCDQLAWACLLLIYSQSTLLSIFITTLKKHLVWLLFGCIKEIISSSCVVLYIVSCIQTLHCVFNFNIHSPCYFFGQLKQLGQPAKNKIYKINKKQIDRYPLVDLLYHAPIGHTTFLACQCQAMTLLSSVSSSRGP